MTPFEYLKLVVHCKKSDYDIYIGRPSEWGNMWSHKDGTLAKYKVETREIAIQKYEEWLLSQPELVAKVKRELCDKILSCHCSPAPCHGHVLARIANEGDEE